MKIDERIPWDEMDGLIPDCARVAGKWNYKLPNPQCPFCDQKWCATVNVDKKWFYCGACGTFATHHNKLSGSKMYLGPGKAYPPGVLQLFGPQIEFVVRYYRPNNLEEAEARSECVERVLMFDGELPQGRRRSKDLGALDSWYERTGGDLGRVTGMVFNRLKSRLVDFSRRRYRQTAHEVSSTNMDRNFDIRSTGSKAVGRDAAARINSYSERAGKIDSERATGRAEETPEQKDERRRTQRYEKEEEKKERKARNEAMEETTARKDVTREDSWKDVAPAAEDFDLAYGPRVKMPNKDISRATHPGAVGPETADEKLNRLKARQADDALRATYPVLYRLKLDGRTADAVADDLSLSESTVHRRAREERRAFLQAQEQKLRRLRLWPVPEFS